MIQLVILNWLKKLANTDKPLEDEQLIRLTSKMTQMKRQISNSIKKAHSSATEISKLRENGMNSNNLVITRMIRTGAGHVEFALSVKPDLEKATTVLN